MKWIFCVSAVFFSFQSQAAERPVDSPLCKKISMAIVENAGAEFNRFTDDGKSVIFNSPLIDNLSLDCENRVLTYVTIEVSTPFPTPLMFEIAAQVGRAVSGDDVDVLQVAIKDCHKEAINREEHLGGRDIGNTRINCVAATDSPFSQFTLALWDKQNRGE